MLENLQEQTPAKSRDNASPPFAPSSPHPIPDHELLRRIGQGSYGEVWLERTATVERIPDPAGLDLEAIWDEEWEKNLAEAAIERVKRQVKAKQFQMFELYVVQQWPVKDVAQMLRVSVAQIYLARHRIARLVKKEIKRLEKQSG